MTSRLVPLCVAACLLCTATIAYAGGGLLHGPGPHILKLRAKHSSQIGAKNPRHVVQYLSASEANAIIRKGRLSKVLLFNPLTIDAKAARRLKSITQVIEGGCIHAP